MPPNGRRRDRAILPKVRLKSRHVLGSDVEQTAVLERPRQVTQDFYLLLAASALGVVGGILHAVLFWQERLVDLDPAVLISWGLLYVLPFWIAFKVNAGRNWARWLVVAGVVLSIFVLPGLLRTLGDYPVQSALSLLAYATDAIAVFLLFRSPASNWFKSQPARAAAYDLFAAAESTANANEAQPEDKSAYDSGEKAG